MLPSYILHTNAGPPKGRSPTGGPPAIATGGPPALKPNLAFVAGDYDVYAGTYVDPHLVGDIIVTHAGNDLLVEMPDLDAASIPYEPLLAPRYRHNFNVTIQGYPMQVTFILDAQGGAEYLRTRLFVGRR